MNREERRARMRKAKPQSKNITVEEFAQLVKKDGELEKSGKVYIHAVFETDNEDGPVKCHTHNMELYGLRNLCMRVPDKRYVPLCQDCLYTIAVSMIHGEKYRVNTGHVIDEYEGGPVCHIFDLVDSDDTDNRTGEKNLEVEYCWFGIYDYGGKSWIFDHGSLKWVPAFGKK